MIVELNGRIHTAIADLKGTVSDTEAALMRAFDANVGQKQLCKRNSRRFAPPLSAMTQQGPIRSARSTRLPRLIGICWKRCPFLPALARLSGKRVCEIGTDPPTALRPKHRAMVARSRS